MSPDITKTRETSPGRVCPECGLEWDASVTVCPRDGRALLSTESVLDLANDPVFRGKYEFLGTIGAGGMGLIYKARQMILDKMMAIKVVHAHLGSADAFQRFQVEGKAASLLSHPYIISVHDFGVTDAGQPYMVMDFVDGKTLGEVITRDGQLSIERFLRIFCQVCEALAHAHKRGVLHRDLKPSNIMLVRTFEGEEEVRIMDFGIAKLIGDTGARAQALTKTGEAVGSPLYMSPEQARGHKTDTRTDVYSLGCVMYECITGSPPFVGKSALDTMLMHMNDKPLNIRQASLGKIVDPRVERVVMKLLDKNPDERYQKMDEILADLYSIQGNTGRGASSAKLPVADTVAGQPVPKESSSVKTVGIALACILILGCVALGGFYLWNSSQQKPAKVASASGQTTNVVTDTSTSKPLPGDYSDKADPVNMTGSERLSSELGKHQAFITAKDGIDFTKLDMGAFATPNGAFVRQLNLKKLNLTDTDLEPIKNLTNVEFLDLDENSVQDLHAISNMKSLKFLYLKNAQTNAKGMKTLGEMHNLVILILTSNAISDKDLEHLYGLSKLRVLDITQCPNLKSDKAVAELQAHLPKCYIVSKPPSTNNYEWSLLNRPFSLLAKEKWKEADADFAYVQNLLASEPAGQRTPIVVCLISRGDCQTLFKPPQFSKALDLYKQARQLIDEDDEYFPIICTKKALAYEMQQKPGDAATALELRKTADTSWRKHPPKALGQPYYGMNLKKLKEAGAAGY